MKQKKHAGLVGKRFDLEGSEKHVARAEIARATDLHNQALALQEQAKGRMAQAKQLVAQTIEAVRVYAIKRLALPERAKIEWQFDDTNSPVAFVVVDPDPPKEKAKPAPEAAAPAPDVEPAAAAPELKVHKGKGRPPILCDKHKGARGNENYKPRCK